MIRCRWDDCRHSAIANAVAPESSGWTIPASVPVCGSHVTAAKRAGWTPNLRGHAVRTKGFGWRVWNDEDYWSMVPTNPDNSPIPQPVTWFIPAELLGEVVDWLGVPDWSGPQMPEALARRIAVALTDRGAPP